MRSQRARQAIGGCALAGLTLGAVHAADLLLFAGSGIPARGRWAALPGVVGLLGCAGLACAPVAAGVIALLERAAPDRRDAAWALSLCVAGLPAGYVVHRLYLLWAGEPLDFPNEAAAGIGAAAAAIAGGTLVAGRLGLHELAGRAVDALGPRLMPLMALLAAAPLYWVATRTLPSVHLDGRLPPFLVALIALAFAGWRAGRGAPRSGRGFIALAMAGPLLAVAGHLPTSGRKAVRQAAPLADAVAELGMELGDLDGDGYPGWLVLGPDCDDGDPAIHPAAPERAGNDADDNCLAGDARPGDAAKARAMLGLGASEGDDAAPTVPGSPPLVVLITVDALRADRLTPQIMLRTWDLANRGARFGRAYSPGSHTQSSLAPLLTGRYLGRMVRVTPGAGMRVDVDATLAGLLASRGWHTLALQTAGLPAPLLNGFDDRVDLGDLGDDFKRLRTTPLLVRELLARLRDRPANRPMFAWLHTMDVHAPYRPSYDAQVTETDAALGALYDRLRADHPGAILAVSADHGEALGERGRFGHGRTLDDDQVRVPLVVVGPGTPAGFVDEGIVELLDLPPTLLQMAGVAPPPWMDGRSLRPLLEGRPRPGGRRAFLEIRGLGASSLRAVVTPKVAVVRDLRRGLRWVRPDDGDASARRAAELLLMAWEEGALSRPDRGGPPGPGPG